MNENTLLFKTFLKNIPIKYLINKKLYGAKNIFRKPGFLKVNHTGNFHKFY